MAERYTVFSDPNGIRDAKVGEMGAVIAMVPTQALAFARELVRLANRGDKSEVAVAEFWVEEKEKENLDGPNPVP